MGRRMGRTALAAVAALGAISTAPGPARAAHTYHLTINFAAPQSTTTLGGTEKYTGPSVGPDLPGGTIVLSHWTGATCMKTGNFPFRFYDGAGDLVGTIDPVATAEPYAGTTTVSISQATGMFRNGTGVGTFTGSVEGVCGPDGVAGQLVLDITAP